MKHRKAQGGMSVLGLVLLAVIVACAVLLGLKLIPIYVESFKIDNVLKAVIEDPEVVDQSKQQILLSIVRRLDIEGVDRIHDNNFREYGEIIKEGDNVYINISYRTETPLFGNLSLVADFDKSVQN